ncbi:hypothetical protein [Paracoccus sp. pheM1]|uniref:hypothetical protein n=1 Tax=Paracoccus sp. pheM1 TaxID=2831675 RepID=UPI001BDB7DAC|nr:hypothetical protein [Paracoccus sp. pheM1]MBT0780847.1 hypothetical protein [Paracoccus sp. pheM1]
MPPEKPTDQSDVEDRLLASIELVGAAQACALLRIETDDPEGAMQAIVRDDAIIALVHDGRTVFPRCQFDVGKGRVFDVVSTILKRRTARISNLRLCYWLTRAHVDFGEAPAQRFGHDDTAILAAFRRYIEPNCHG